jgi:hypothetical protein
MFPHINFVQIPTSFQGMESCHCGDFAGPISFHRAFHKIPSLFLFQCLTPIFRRRIKLWSLLRPVFLYVDDLLVSGINTGSEN